MEQPYPRPLPATDRPVGWALFGAGILALGLAFALGGITQTNFQKTMSASLATVNLGLLVIFLLRARWFPEERRGWLLLAAAVPLVLASNGVLTLGGPLESKAGLADTVFIGLSLLIGLVQASAFLSWPWRRDEQGPSLLDLLGSLLFGASIFLLMWMIGLWSAAFQGQTVIQARILALAGRLAITSGTVIYLVSQDPRRLKGPLGWVLGSLCLFALTLGLLRPLIVSARTTDPVSPGFALALLAPLFLAMAAWSRHPVEVPSDRPPLRLPLGELLPFTSFLLAVGFLAVALVRRPGPFTWPLLAFLGITVILILRQFLLLREVRRAKARLEERVLQRTLTLERMQAILLKTERMNALATVGAGLTHDLNNLLSVIGNYASLVQTGLHDGRPPSHQDLDRILEASARAGQLTQRLMAFVRRDPEFTDTLPMGISDTVASTREILRMLLPANIRLEVDIDPTSLPVRVQSAVLEQVLVNLVSNAKDAMPGGGAVTLRLHPGSMPGGRPAAILEVSDTGPGIPLEAQERVFNAFYTTKPQGKGTGLGLASVRALMEIQGGTVEVESLPQQGTTFRLAFPVPA